jgi:hypothetical protein
MSPVAANPILGVFLHGVGAWFAETCYTPQKQVKRWSWQTFFYNLGHVRMGAYKFTSWAIHMIMLVLFSNLVGIALRESRACRRLTDRTIALALLVLVAAVLLLTYQPVEKPPERRVRARGLQGLTLN